ncbi:MAG: SDR family oxidoreductase [Planctomycetes bacterium]|nr:SDR family oxidoreductase [Planctomycetota bacterium]
MCVVTGGTSGIGRATAAGLSNLGARVILPCRTLARGEGVARELSEASGNEVRAMACDLSSLGSIRAFAEAFERDHDRVHVLVNSAGIVSTSRTETPDGFEATFGVTYLGAFLLTSLLLPLLKAGAPSRIVNVAGEFHRKVRLDLDDLQLERRYSIVRAGGQAMLAKIMFTFELARRLEGTGVTANCLHPGAVRSGLLRGLPWYLRAAASLGRPFMKSPEVGARTPIYLATSPDVASVSGEYFANERPRATAEHARDAELGLRLWEESVRLAGLP